MMQAGSYVNSDGTQSLLLHMWSLAVEEQFYFVWPLVIGLVALLVRHRRRRHVVALAVTGLLVLASAWWMHACFDPRLPDRTYMGTDAKAFEPLLGALAVILLTLDRFEGFVRRHAVPLVWSSAVVMTLLFWRMDGPAPLYFHGGALLFSVAVAVLIVAVVRADGSLPARVLSWAPMAYLGRISYGIYLWHWPYAVWLDAHDQFSWWRAAAVVALTVVTAALSYHFVEQPILNGTWFTAPRTVVAAALAMAPMLCVSTPLGGSPLTPLAQRILPEGPVNPDMVMLVGDSVPQRLAPALGPVERLTAHGAILVVVLTERPSQGMLSRCSERECHPFLKRITTQDDLRLRWNKFLQDEARRDKRLRTMSMESALCVKEPAAGARGFGASLCYDKVGGKRLRPDGSHVDVPLFGERVGDQFMKRLLAAR